MEIAAEAQAERIRREAKGEADGILLRYQAEARRFAAFVDQQSSWLQEAGR